MAKFTVVVDTDDIIAVQKAFYEYNGTKDIIGFLAQDPNVQWEVMDEYRKVAAIQYTACEMEKSRVAKAYKPDECADLDHCNYSYDFMEETITYEEVL